MGARAFGGEHIVLNGPGSFVFARAPVAQVVAVEEWNPFVCGACAIRLCHDAGGEGAQESSPGGKGNGHVDILAKQGGADGRPPSDIV